MLFIGGVAIGIEVKLYSDLSGENQLKRELGRNNNLNETTTKKYKNKKRRLF